jgi:hypothetical protein
MTSVKSGHFDYSPQAPTNIAISPISSIMANGNSKNEIKSTTEALHFH